MDEQAREWKERYLNQLDRSESQEKQWREERHALQRLLVRASLAAEGQDQQLDDVLAQLRQMAREEDPPLANLKRLQDRLDELVLSWDSRRTGNLDRLREALHRLTGHLLQQNPQRSEKRALKQLEKRVRKETLNLGNLPTMLSELARIQNQVTVLEASGGFFDRLFRRQSEEDVESPQSSPVSAEPAQEGEWLGPESDLDMGQSVIDQDELTQFAHRIRSLIGQLLEQLALPETAERRAQALQERLVESQRWEQVRTVVEEISHLVVAAVGRGRRDFEEFLGRLDERLARIQEFMRDGLTSPEIWQEVNESFDRDMQQGLQQLTDAAGRARDLQSLQSSVRGQVETLSQTLQQFQKKQQERESQLNTQIDLLQDKLVALESQSDAMKQQLMKERERATTDALTQLPNREALEERLELEFARWKRYGNRISLAVLDIDHFKTVNDRYGHLAGDKVIQLVARALREQLRETDFIARFGGEEFVVLLPETDEAAAFQVCEKLRERIAGLPFHFRRERVAVTLSAGVIAFQDASSPDELFDRADRALYRAKEAGRNRVESGGPDNTAERA
ncbi:diguanylate cyclase [Marinobacteraceae bacterium S3BR75-40.1]